MFGSINTVVDDVEDLFNFCKERQKKKGTEGIRNFKYKKC